VTLAKHLKKRHLTIAEFARRIGLSRQGAQAIVSGKVRRPHGLTVAAMARELGVSEEKVRRMVGR
jgi:plasmid maintenance system antidote protein VapI